MKTKRIDIRLLVGVILGWVVLPSVGHTVPAKINYQGYLTGSGGTPINATVPIVFSLYNTASGGTALWSETQTVVVASGIYSVNLGSVNPITLPFDAVYYLGVKVGTDVEMTPRQVLTSVGYAFRAAWADGVLAGGLPNHVHTGGDITSGLVAEPRIDSAIARTTALNAHTTNMSNPHSTTAAQVGAAIASHNHDSSYVNVTGDTMTGALNLPANGLAVGTNQLVVTGGRVGLGTAVPNEQLEITGNLRMPTTTASGGVIKAGTDRFIHNYGTGNFFAGIKAGNLTMSGVSNTGIGVLAVQSNTTGQQNTGVGAAAL